MKPNRRSYSRVTAKFHSELAPQGEGDWLSGDTHDLSMKGLFIDCPHPLPEGSDGSVRLFLGDPKTRPLIEASVKVARQTQKGMGVEFTEMDLESYTHLHDLVLMKSNEPKKILEELNHPLGFTKRSRR